MAAIEKFEDVESWEKGAGSYPVNLRSERQRQVFA